MRPVRSVLSLVCLISLVGVPAHPLVAESVDPLDWPTWNGPQQNRVSLETGLVDRFDPKGGEGSNVLFKSELAAGISTPIVMHGRLFTIVRDQPGTRMDAEKVICLDAETGELLWENVYNVFLSDLPAERVGWSNVCGDPETDRVYALGACCLLQCIDAQTGKTLWSRSLSEEFGMLSTYGGRTNTPVVFEDLVIISGVTTGWDESAKPAHRFLAFNKRDGRLVWITSTRPLPEDTTYSTPVIRQIAGKTVMVAGAGDGNIYGMQPRTGKILWRETISRRGINTSVAIGEDGKVYATHGEENPTGTAMGAIVCVDAPYATLDSASAEKWRTEEITVGKSSPLLVDNRLYVVEDSSRMHVLDVDTGEAVGKPLKLGTAMRGSLLYADGKIYAATSTGIIHVLRPTDEGVETLFKIRLPKGHDVGGSPIVSHGRIYLPTTGGLYCIGDSSDGMESQAVTATEPASTSHALSGDDRIARLQLIPAEAIVAPGSDLALEVASYLADGRRIDPPSMERIRFDVSGDASVDKNGVLRVAADAAPHSQVTVTASFEEASVTSQLRVIPALPWSFDFGAGDVPITWIGARYRHEARVVDGDPAIVKITTIPKGTRSQTWFGPTDLHDYTITADVKAQEGEAKLPDIGLIAQRYTLDLMGESQQLQIRTWAAQLRMAKSVPVEWKAGQWYTLKFQATVENGVAVLRGKFWERQQPEPRDWNITAIDEAANVEGSPGMYGNSTNAEISIDNVSVKANP
ncbi:PQQ-binding-like beta-propeller repeat protein [Allorhodopirellula heiligendammensis]|uniref:Outer membrane biogenesis protein BamB n=1 Tax=Allorhodopirellula heiligendammensis TaxID=2714739 RepID=A0A5C6BZP4_9BACT|nr:PQQ-binding-like beta-propeller repeat protein [Allorhodopirellula heiligendammensis]TWU16089.1 outer membrane biogenesis protein BamB [Allorhodopirellula heiligendammensis]